MNNQPMMCDFETGVCGAVDDAAIEPIDLNRLAKKVTLYYVTDPICSHCWALEPVLKRFIQEYSQYFQMEVIMGGLLPGWQGFSDGGNGIQQPADVAGHWREVGEHSRMPIDGSLWLTNPILSSYPPSRVFKVIQKKHPGQETEFLRRAREAVFVFNQNIGEAAVLAEIVDKLGLHGQQIVVESALDAAQDLLDEDFRLAARLGVRGFPTIIMVNEDNKGVKIVGARALLAYTDGLQQITNEEIKAAEVAKLANVLDEERILFSKEIEVMYGIAKDEVSAFIEADLSEDSYSIQSIMGELYVKRR